METKDYWIYKNKIIFKPEFNNNPDTYLDIISKYNELIFSNYDDFNIMIKTNNKYYEEYDKNIIYSYFNQQLTIPQSVTHLTFGWRFNQPIIIPQNVTHLTFNGYFNQQIIIPENVIHLTFGWKFDQQITIPQNVIHLTFGYCFNQQEIIPQNVTHLTFGHDFNQPIIIPQNITYLTFGWKFNQHVIIPQNITYLTFDHYFNQPIIIPQNVIHLTFGWNFDQPVTLPNIKYIKLGCDNIDIIENLPNSIEEIIFSEFFNLELQNLPNSIKKISFDYYSDYNKELNCLPEFVEYLELGIKYDKKIKKFPLNLKTIKCYKKYKYIDDFKGKYNVITY